ncbi:MAG: glycosyltransferase family 39 protein [Acetatifactor sp.]|nr:glycosyltransferase family 39 protein [Acetatifactor sp.]
MLTRLRNQDMIYKIAIMAILAFALFLRVFRLTQLPDALHFDEASVGYNAWCLAHYGVDRYLNKMPVYVQNLSGGQSPLYTYSAALLLKLFGKGNISLFLVRLPGVIFSMLVVIYSSKIVSSIFQSRKITVMCALLITVCPYFFMHGRFALDCNLMLGCCLVSLYCLIRYIRSRRLSHLIICGICFGITLYSYAMSYFAIPIFLCAAALYLLYTRRTSLPQMIIWAVAVCVTALPIILYIFSLLFQLPPYRFLCFTIAPIASYRINDVAATDFWENIATTIRITLTHGYEPMDSVRKFYTMYPVSIPFIVIGFFCSIYHFIFSLVRRHFHYSSVMVLFFISGLIANSMVNDIPRVYRANYFFASYIYFLILGIVSVYRFLKLYRQLFIGALALSYLLWGLSFYRYYYSVYSVHDLYQYPNVVYLAYAEEPISFVENELDTKAIYCDYITATIYYVFCNPISPYEFTDRSVDETECIDRHYFTVNYYTPVASGNAYIVRKENYEFITKLYSSGVEFDRWDYDHYYVFYCR